jgi:predicted membrane protein DUF2142
MSLILCLNDTVDTSGCTEVSYTGDYFPLVFGLPAVAIGRRAVRTLWLGRAASLLPVLLFLALALAYPRRRSGWATLGVLAAVTPMVLFIGAALAAAGLLTPAVTVRPRDDLGRVRKS